MKPWIAWAATGLLWIGLMTWYLARRFKEGFERLRCACLGHVWDIARAIQESRPVIAPIPHRPYLELKSLHCAKCGKVLELK